MMLCTGISCGDLTGKRYSEKLDCALSTKQDFFYIDMFVNDVVGPNYSHEGKFTHKRISTFIPEFVGVDEENEVLTINDDAIVDAYDFNGLDDTELELFANALVQIHENNNPGCEFELIPGEFPIGIEGRLIVNDKVRKEEKPILSSHILCVKDYKKHIEKDAVKQKK